MSPHSDPARLHLELALTAGEIRELHTRAAAELRLPGPFVTRLVAEHLRPRSGSVSSVPIAKGVRRRFDVQLALTARERRKLEGLARAEERSVAGYVSLVLARALKAD